MLGGRAIWARPPTGAFPLLGRPAAGDRSAATARSSAALREAVDERRYRSSRASTSGTRATGGRRAGGGAREAGSVAPPSAGAGSPSPSPSPSTTAPAADEAPHPSRWPLPLPGQPVVLLGVDPDLSGAVAVLEWGGSGGAGGADGAGGAGGPDGAGGLWVGGEAEGGSRAPGSSPSGLLSTASACIRLLDMPTTLVPMASRSKRQHDARALLGALRELADPRDRGAPPLLLAALEATSPAPVSGKHAWYGAGYSTGLLDGLFEATGVSCARVHASTWKRELGLFKAGKEGSIALAVRLFPQASPHLARKKDHGRAEALLIAAWALGEWRAGREGVGGEESRA